MNSIKLAFLRNYKKTVPFTHEWSNVRKNLFALQSMYRFGGKQGFLKLDPEIVVLIDGLLQEIDSRIDESKQEQKSKVDEELEPWLKKYDIWQKLQG